MCVFVYPQAEIQTTKGYTQSGERVKISLIQRFVSGSKTIGQKGIRKQGKESKNLGNRTVSPCGFDVIQTYIDSWSEK